MKKLIHLLYVPTLSCNMGCSYCYLGNQTDRSFQEDLSRAESTLTEAIRLFEAADILPFNISLHGGEVTTLPESILGNLYKIIENHYRNHYDELRAAGFTKMAPHIKTNLLNFAKLQPLFEKYRVSISGSVDLPLNLHESYRTAKNGSSTRAIIEENLRLLAKYPHAKKISATLYREHISQVDQLITDIRYIHNDLGFDMNLFNFMFGFESDLNSRAHELPDLDTSAVPDELQVAFYNRLKQEFVGTELEEGFRKNWFDEFMPSYCTNAVNCGEKFFLLHSDGSVWSCVRGQGSEPFFYGNIFTDPIESILAAGSHKIGVVHQQREFHHDCQQCEYLHICHTGCPFVKFQKSEGKSYTCALQKQIYRDYPKQFPPLTPEEIPAVRDHYIAAIHPQLSHSIQATKPKLIIPTDFAEPKNELVQIIATDPILTTLYDPESIVLELNGELIPMESQILKTDREIQFIGQDDSVKLHISRSFVESHYDDLTRNTIYVQMLRDTPVIYGDEQRTKQEHLFTYQVYYRQLKTSGRFGKSHFEFDISDLLRIHKELFIEGILNNLFVTTSFLRDYHYTKQKNNGFYHIQALNLPFQNVEFYWEGELHESA